MRKGYIEKCKPFIGKTYGKLTIQNIVDSVDEYGRIMCKCLCSCGRECVKPLRRVVSLHVQSCGECGYIQQRAHDVHALDILNSKGNYARLTPLYPTSERRWGQIVWHCVCSCGRECDVVASRLKDHNTNSCGKCGYKESQITKLKTIYDTEDKKRMARIFWGMCRRCNDPNNPDYPNYGGRGIKISPVWPTAKEFVEWGLKSGYKPGLTIDRINVNLGYSPDNCRWATKLEQSKNTRYNIKLTVEGKTYVASDWDKILGLYKGCIGRYHRLYGEIKTIYYIESLLHNLPNSAGFVQPLE